MIVSNTAVVVGGADYTQRWRENCLYRFDERHGRGLISLRHAGAGRGLILIGTTKRRSPMPRRIAAADKRKPGPDLHRNPALELRDLRLIPE
ncbi:hypothetical protein [Herbaspirillum robiniae]|uniref:hypothetical protein n=1 Tax=Herbaspirillum robiniae TaxID=2014887 RepID=UPI00101AD0D7|nr:hypothetical protein [Herbaspirillum robiniae]